VAPGGILTVTLANGPGSATDWVTLNCPATQADTVYADWKYLSDTRTAPASGLTGATVHLTVPGSATTTCNVRWFGHDTFTKLATSATMPVALAPSITTMASGGTMTVTVANGPASPTDWVALYCPATPANPVYADWKYLSDTRVAPGTGLSGATVHLTVPASASMCNVRWYANDTFTPLATSTAIPVTGPTITLTPPAAPGGVLVVTLTNGPGSPTDWVTLNCPATQADAVYVDWKYLSDTRSAPGSGLTEATLHFTVPAAATTCNVRWFGHDTFTKLTTSATLSWPTLVGTVTGGTLSVTLGNGPGSPTDWVALYCPATQPDALWVDWKYLNNTRVAPLTGVTGATVQFPVPPGAATCNLRWYAHDTFTLVATSATITVVAPTITVPATTVPGSPLTVTLANGPGSPTDWVALYCPTTQPDTVYVDWKYLSNTRTAPGSGLTAVTLDLAVPLSATTCNVRWFANDTFVKLATSAAVTVQ